MIRYKDTILENYFIDPVTAIITNSKSEIQKTKIRDGRPYFKGHGLHEWQVHTYLEYKKGFDIHHLDENKLNNSLSNLVYLTHSEHITLHKKGKTLSEEIKQKISEAKKGERNGMYGKHHSLETKKKMSEAKKGERNGMYGKHLSSEAKKKLSEVNKGELNPFYGKTHSNESKRKISDSLKGKYKWITNGIENRLIDKNIPIPDGFRKGVTRKK